MTLEKRFYYHKSYSANDAEKIPMDLYKIHWRILLIEKFVSIARLSLKFRTHKFS